MIGMNAATMELSSEPANSQPQPPASNAIPIEMTRSNVYNYTWKIDSVYSRHPWSLQRSMQSPVFSIGPESQLRWLLVLYPRGPDFQSSYSSLYLRCDNLNESEVKAECSFRLIHSHPWVITPPERREYCVFKRGPQTSSYGYEKFQLELHRYNGSFDINCEIDVLEDAGEPFKVPDGKLLDDMAAVFTAKKHTDFKITSGEVSFPVHKAILSARSSVFASMFEHDTTEQRENCVNMTDTTPKVLEEMLRFIYTDKVIEIETVAWDLLALAEKYDLNRLKVMCEKALRGSLAIENAAEILILADLYRSDGLKAQAIDFIKNQIEHVMETSGFEMILKSHPHLTAEILRAALLNKNK